MCNLIKVNSWSNLLTLSKLGQQKMEPSVQKFHEKMFRMDRCRKYFPRYDEKTFEEEIQYTQGQLIQYLPQRFVEQHQNFKQAGYYIKGGFWTIDILFVTFCQRIKLISRVLGENGWKLFIFKLAAVAFPLQFINKIEEDAKYQFNQSLYKGVQKIYKRYKLTGDILDLNVKIVLEDNQTQIQRICHLNEFNLLHGHGQKIKENKSSKIV